MLLTKKKKKKLYIGSHLLSPRFWNLDRTVWSDRENFEPFIFAVLLISRTALWEKCRDPCDPRSDLMVLRTVIKPFLTVPCFPLNLNLKKKKKTQKNKRKRNTIVGSTSCLQKHCHYHLQRNKACLYVSSSSSSLFKEHHAAPSIQKLFSLAN